MPVSYAILLKGLNNKGYLKKRFGFNTDGQKHTMREKLISLVFISKRIANEKELGVQLWFGHGRAFYLRH